MAEHSRYSVSDKAAGISKGILINKLGIKTQKDLDDTESLLFTDTYKYFFELLKDNKIEFSRALLFSIHEYLFCSLYSWAGKIRTVNISKGDMLFAPVEYIDNSLKEFAKLLKTELSQKFKNKNDISKTLALIHNEFNVIHLFREGNGRTIRLFLDLFASNAGYNPIDWSKNSKSAYLKACVAGAVKKHVPMARIIKQGLTKI